MSVVRTGLLMALLFVLCTSCTKAEAQSPLHAISHLAWRNEGAVIRHRVAAGEPFTVAGTQGILVGQQQGPFEAWILPVKLLSHLTLQAEVADYSVPLDLNTMAREIEVRPDRTTIIYSHIALTVRQTMFAPDDAPTGTGAVVLFEIDSLRPVTLTIRFTPELREMWPKPSSGTSSAEWVPQGQSGMYVLHSDSASLSGSVALPGSLPGIMAPYQERPQVHPLELILHYDPVRDRGQSFPLLMAVGQTRNTAANDALAATLGKLNDSLAGLYAAHAARYARQEEDFTSIVTPDAALNADLLWAETSIGQLRARTSDGETGLVAGYYASGDSARPGFGWYFGRDTLYTIYAIDSYGDFSLARTALEFLLRRQRADGKVMHEYSQTAASVDWSSLPYEYAAADATPLMLTALLDYVRSSGDVSFLRAHREAVLKAWQFETNHDSDGDGIYDNSQGTGWVESWPGGIPHQEVYLALLDEQASQAVAELAGLLGEQAIADSARLRSADLHSKIEKEYFEPARTTYAFSRDAQGALDHTASVFPAVAWWNGGPGLDHSGASLSAWASHLFDTDWGVRDVSGDEKIYDGTSYHQGSVWPLFTGWVALAQYRSGHPLAGYLAAMQNADLTCAQDYGAVTELLSGDFFEPFGRSTSHQLWSSAMVVTPLLRGLFGIDVDALGHSLRLTPHLPASWPEAEVRRLRVGESVVNLHYKRQGIALIISAETVAGPVVQLQGGKTAMRVPLPPVQVEVTHGLPLRGARTEGMKVVGERYGTRSLDLDLEDSGGSQATLSLIVNDPSLHPEITGATLLKDQLLIRFAKGQGYVSQHVRLTW